MLHFSCQVLKLTVLECFDHSQPRVRWLRYRPLPKERLNAAARFAKAVLFDGVELIDRKPQCNTELPPSWGNCVHDPDTFLFPTDAPFQALELLDTGSLTYTWKYAANFNIVDKAWQGMLEAYSPAELIYFIGFV